MKTSRLLLLLPFLLAASGLLAECPACAGAGAPKDTNIWPIVGVFMLVPWVLGGVVAVVVRREAARPA